MFERRLFVTLDAVKKLHCFTKLAAGEVTGIGMVERCGRDFVVTDIFTLKQSASHVHAEVDPEALNDFFAEFVERGGDPSQLRFQWHSHANMGVYFSPDDLKNIENCVGDFRTSLVVNKLGGYSCRFDLFKPFRAQMEDVQLLVLAPSLPPVNIDAGLAGACREEIRRNVRENIVTIGENTAYSLGESVFPRLFESLFSLEGSRHSSPTRRTISFRGIEYIYVPYEFLVFEDKIE